MNLMKLYRQNRLFGLLALFTLFDALLLVVRLEHVGFEWASLLDPWELRHDRGNTFLFLAWNLFLAWIPFLIAHWLGGRSYPNRPVTYVALMLWLLFFPNAPYILTDLFHLYPREGVPYWFDLMLLLSFAWTGLLVGLASLREIHWFAERRWSKAVSYGMISAAVFLGSYGVYLGRYQRWNSWDLFTNPFSLFGDILATILEPTAGYPIGLTFVLAGFMGLSYLVLMEMGRSR